ncbi:tyrosine-type recombinase/integrase [Zunongwangia atlantica]|uniref:Integrase n=1 Tax=Zunongwangia atlantica 22II14-10F7 TaxID=1185767 RepID=A0A1Y1SY67_9FLAO|nr:site-specific integrase [Zunongwangia atlantica]ORL43711.1 integrase [Zunongwangia atlantica 22II14-10F7]
MKGKIKLYRNDGESDQGFPVKIILSHQRKTRRKTFAYAKATEWDNTYDLPLGSHPDYEDLYDQISQIKKIFGTRRFNEQNNFDAAFEMLDTSPRKQSLRFIDYGEERAKYMDQVSRTGNARAYRIALKELKKYSSIKRLDEIDRHFMEGFKQHKKSEGLKNTSVRNYLYELRAIYNNAVRTGIIEDKKPFANLFNDIPVRKRRARNAYLEKDDIIKLENTTFTQLNYNRAKDLALLQFYLCGADFMDVCFLRKEQIHNGRVFLKRAKLGEKAYEFDILLHPKAEKIINRYQGSDEVFVFDWPRSEAGYRTFRVKMYRALQQVKKKLEITLSPKDATLTLKVMRHTFATHGKFARIEEDLLRELMGHERNDIDTVYKDKYPEAERDKAQKLIIE